MLSKILSQPRQYRNVIQMANIVKQINDHPFFVERGMRDGQVVDMLQAMEHDIFEPDEIVFEHASVGDLFYMILDGEVEVLIPD